MKIPSGVRPTRHEMIDVAAASLLAVLGVVGFHTSFGGISYLIVGAVGAVVGAAVGFGLVRARLPLVVGAAVALVGFLGAGSILVARDTVLVGFLPTPAGVLVMIDGAVNGWAHLLTAFPPVGSADDLLVIPFLCGYFGALAGVVLAMRLPRRPLCVVPGVAVVVVSALFGTERPASLLLQGGVLGAAAIGWMSLRETRRRPVLVDTGRSSRLVSGSALLAVAALGAVVVGPRLPGGHTDRYVLRERTEPPFDAREYPSPLVGLRRFLDESHKDQPQFVVDGLPPKELVQLAVMDVYDGLVWSVGSPAQDSGRFERVGERIPPDHDGPEAAIGGRVQTRSVAFDIQNFPSVWMPVAGAVRSVTFEGARSDDLADSFRFNRFTNSAAQPIRLAPNDSYQLSVAVAPQPAADRLTSATVDLTVEAPVPPSLPIIKEKAAAWSAGANEPYLKVQKIAAALAEGYYSDGGPQSGIPPGHSLFRINAFLSADQLQGDAEQYAATMALMVRSLGLPARVVMGFAPSDGGQGAVTVKGSDVRAWVEVPFESVGWVRFFPTPPPDRNILPETQPKPKSDQVETQPPPPSSVPPQDPRLDDAEEAAKRKKDEKPTPGKGIPFRTILTIVAIPGLPALSILGSAGIVVLLKTRRRTRRRTTGPPAARVAGAWQEVLDVARDMGRAVPARATRQEAAQFVALTEGGDLASTTDAVLFGVAEPTDEVAAELWRRTEKALADSVGALPTKARVRAAVSVTSLRGER